MGVVGHHESSLVAVLVSTGWVPCMNFRSLEFCTSLELPASANRTLGPSLDCRGVSKGSVRFFMIEDGTFGGRPSVSNLRCSSVSSMQVSSFSTVISMLKTSTEREDISPSKVMAVSCSAESPIDFLSSCILSIIISVSFRISAYCSSRSSRSYVCRSFSHLVIFNLRSIPSSECVRQVELDLRAFDIEEL